MDAAVTAALFEELLRPIVTVGIRASAWASESVTLVGKRPEVFVPSTDSTADIHVGLPGFVDPEESGLIQAGEQQPDQLLRTR